MKLFHDLASFHFQRSTRRHLLQAFVLALLCVAGCAAPVQLVHDGKNHPAEWRSGRMRPAGIVADIADHVIVIDGRGLPHNPRSPDSEPLTIEQFRSQLAGMFSAMREFHKAHPERKVLIFVHGGLTPPAHALAAADRDLERVMDAGYFPIFLNWNSELVDSYGEHLTRITQGHTDDGIVRKLLSPLYLFADIGRAVTRAPVVWANQIGSDSRAAGADLNALPNKTAILNAASGLDRIRSQRWAATPKGQAIASVVERLSDAQEKQERQPQATPNALRIYIGPDLEIDAGRLAVLEAKYILTSPGKFGLSWLLDGFGTPAWHNMSRRTLMAFDGELGGQATQQEDPVVQATTRKDRSLKAKDFRTTGAFEVFRAQFFKVVETRDEDESSASAGKPYQVTLVGHSMGTMVLNEWLRRDLLEDRPHAYGNIVYMAAACSVRDFGRAVIPYLLEHRSNAETHFAGTQFYNLMLHPLAELREKERAYDIPPRGSLLVWLDDFLTDPQTPLDRTLGRWDNLLPVVDMIPEAIRGQIALKAFALAPNGDGPPLPRTPNYGPQAHGAFRDQPYWCPEFWFSKLAIVPGDDCAEKK